MPDCTPTLVHVVVNVAVISWYNLLTVTCFAAAWCVAHVARTFIANWKGLKPW